MKKPKPIIFSLYRFTKGLLNYPNFFKDFFAFKKRGSIGRFEIAWKNRYPCLNDKTSKTPFDRHYVLHTAWASRKVAEIKPHKHIDISSNIYFCTTLSAFIPTEFYDYRPLDIELDNLNCGQADLTSLPFKDNEVESLSCMHTIEHIGLGRYGDPLDPEGDLKAIAELIRVLKPGGHLLFVVPVGKPVLMFNGHRIYSYDQIMSYFKELKLVEFSLITERGPAKILINAKKEMADRESYGCGCFLLKK